MLEALCTPGRLLSGRCEEKVDHRPRGALADLGFGEPGLPSEVVNTTRAAGRGTGQSQFSIEDKGLGAREPAPENEARSGIPSGNKRATASAACLASGAWAPIPLAVQLATPSRRVSMVLEKISHVRENASASGERNKAAARTKRRADVRSSAIIRMGLLRSTRVPHSAMNSQPA